MGSVRRRLLVVGGGQAGLATAHVATRRHDLDVTVLDAAPKPGGSWPHYYDSLTLFSPGSGDIADQGRPQSFTRADNPCTRPVP